MGGFGLFELDTFLAAQKFSWNPSSFDLNEKWKLTLFLKSCGTIANIRKKAKSINKQIQSSTGSLQDMKNI